MSCNKRIIHWNTQILFFRSIIDSKLFQWTPVRWIKQSLKKQQTEWTVLKGQGTYVHRIETCQLLSNSAPIDQEVSILKVHILSKQNQRWGICFLTERPRAICLSVGMTICHLFESCQTWYSECPKKVDDL